MAPTLVQKFTNYVTKTAEDAESRFEAAAHEWADGNEPRERDYAKLLEMLDAAEKTIFNLEARKQEIIDSRVWAKQLAARPAALAEKARLEAEIKSQLAAKGYDRTAIVVIKDERIAIQDQIIAAADTAERQLERTASPAVKARVEAAHAAYSKVILEAQRLEAQRSHCESVWRQLDLARSAVESNRRRGITEEEQRMEIEVYLQCKQRADAADQEILNLRDRAAELKRKEGAAREKLFDPLAT